ncbi:MAG: aminotransferase class I/II-fold pyridoxal phosphate-dependent enzyme [Treponemataceae bacterium]|nr:aminotransferase class I/II-fold pyridoxal phosphate-dependent enzyme [Treponemataceae bacterium]
MINPLAQDLNSRLRNTVPGEMLSDLGLRLFFPRGIISQGAEARKLGKTANATIGMAVSNKTPIILNSIQKEFTNLTPAEAVAYAPTAGNLEYRELWKEQIISKNPSLKNKTFSLPVVVPGLTAGISYLCDLFLQQGDTLLTANPFWDNYSLIVETRRNATLKQFTLFTDNGFNLEAFEKVVKEQAETGKVRILLNFPQNPSGYTPTKDEQAAICRILCDTAEKGANVMVWCDDAYFGLNYEDDIAPESLFACLCDAHERIFAIKIDGPTKEDFAWGFRAGFLTFGGKGLNEEHYEALTKKLMGTIRSSVSCCSTPAQSIMVRAMKESKVEEEKLQYRQVLESRYKKVRKFVDARKGHAVLTALPFNSGYFMCFRCNGINSEDLRIKLLYDYGIGTIAIDNAHLRVAFSSIDDDIIEHVYSTIYKAADELA